jgi:predicted lipid-binding transport protein (Tim44 family)
MKEKPKRGGYSRGDSILGGLIGIILILGVIAFMSQNSLACGCFGLPGVILIIVLIAFSSSLRSPDEDGKIDSQ